MVPFEAGFPVEAGFVCRIGHRRYRQCVRHTQRRHTRRIIGLPILAAHRAAAVLSDIPTCSFATNLYLSRTASLVAPWPIPPFSAHFRKEMGKGYVTHTGIENREENLPSHVKKSYSLGGSASLARNGVAK